MRRRAVAIVAVAALTAGCSGAPEPAPRRPAPTTTATPEAAPAPEPDLDAALSDPVEDSLYPDVGDPGVDALHYDLDLTWSPGPDTLTGTETLTFRSTADAPSFRLDLAEQLQVGEVRVDGAVVAADHTGKDLVVDHPVEAERRYVLTLDYRGTPEPVEAPATRSDLARVGLRVDDDHGVWTVQQPFGAFTWYAVNDHPSDKALYDLTLHVPGPWTGVAGGEQVRDETDPGTGVHTTAYRLDEPAASYLVTLAFGDLERTDDTGPRGLPITYWTPRGDDLRPGLRSTPDALAWLEQRLGPYPFDRAGVLLVDWDGGVETQTLITLVDTEESTSPPVVVHELAHHWYGDQVTPDDWRDLWMSEGMATYLQWLWEAEQEGADSPAGEDAYVRERADEEAAARADVGPPGAYDPDEFASASVYVSGALLWHAVRRTVGDDAFWAAVRSWPPSQDDRSTDRDALLAHLEQQTGTDLDDLWRSWLLDESSPELP